MNTVQECLQLFVYRKDKIVEMENKENIRNRESGLGLLERLYAEESLRLLGKQLSEIRYISDWARLAGYSRGRLCRIIKQHYKMTPSELLVRIRFERIATILREDPEVTSYHVGRQVGLTDEQIGYKTLLTEKINVG